MKSKTQMPTFVPKGLGAGNSIQTGGGKLSCTHAGVPQKEQGGNQGILHRESHSAFVFQVVVPMPKPGFIPTAITFSGQRRPFSSNTCSNPVPGLNCLPGRWLLLLLLLGGAVLRLRSLCHPLERLGGIRGRWGRFYCAAGKGDNHTSYGEKGSRNCI